MDKKRVLSSKEDTFTDSIPEADETLYCDPLETENETGEKPFTPKNKEKQRNNEKKRDKDEFFG